jgi:hypothetical protein
MVLQMLPGGLQEMATMLGHGTLGQSKYSSLCPRSES